MSVQNRLANQAGAPMIFRVPLNYGVDLRHAIATSVKQETDGLRVGTIDKAFAAAALSDRINLMCGRWFRDGELVVEIDTNAGTCVAVANE